MQFFQKLKGGGGREANKDKAENAIFPKIERGERHMSDAWLVNSEV